MLNNSLNQFKKNMQSARDLETIYIALERMTTQGVPKSEILRAEFVALVSALDTYIHDIVRESLKYMYNKTISNEYLTNFVKKNSITNEILLELKIIEIHGYKTYQAPKKITEILSKIEIKFEWKDIIIQLPDIEDRLKLIIERRNKIAHESDINQINGLGEKFQIDISTIKHVVDTIEKIVDSLNTIIITKIQSLS
ncbi:HEPN domain-containing protein [Aliarcobacter butzleri]|uniref:HEPN domain-containing protein n=1 Tax=Aliarcobacter butzleri TaxID=28197 RepID=UPI00263C3495|nr:HEPN domain-containing protein [Aliarcobacter butzleri]MDN5100149.1 HEPN domain-containing protein [Aliarcobacter butzleri]